MGHDLDQDANRGLACRTDFEEEKVTLSCRAILFDMDGTLIDSTPIIHRMWTWWAQRHGLPVEQVLEYQTGRPNRETLRRFVPHLDIEKEFHEFVSLEQTHTDGLRVVPGADRALAIARQGQWAVVTSANRELAEARFRFLGLPLPQVFITAESVKKGKPDPGCFLLAAERLRVVPAECVVFEDSVSGIASGQSAGMTVIAIGNSDRDRTGAAFSVRDFREISITRPDHNGHFEIRTIR